MASWDGDVRARIGAYVGVLRENPDYLVWYSMGLRHRWADWIPGRPSMEYVRGNVNVQDLSDWEWQYDIFYTELGAWKRPTLVAIPHTIIAEFGRKNIKYEVKEPDNLGKVEYKFTEKIDRLENPFRAIGTRTNDDDGTCVVYFDDVYVLR